MAGLVVGVVEARAVERSIAAERARVRAESAERETERFGYLDPVLRHDIPNATNVIHGYTSYVLDTEDVDPEARQRLETVQRQSLRMAETVYHVRTLIEAARDDVERAPIDVAPVIEQQAAALRERHGHVVVETDVPEEATVLADEFVVHVFRGPLENAVEHNDADVRAVTVRVERGDDTAVVEVSDNGAGVPEKEGDAMFQQASGRTHGLGLYLVRKLLDRYDGVIELTETGRDGNTFTAELSRPTGEVATEERVEPFTASRTPEQVRSRTE